ncbi:hypothetical protein G9A89_019254 [Geosiphon pyriformis]|nr:hypothetical protein G9A89_019254 [Geosiphon pyriformis]
MPVFVVIELVGSSASGSILGLAGLGTHLNTKKKHMESVYPCIASYKKPKKPNAGGVLVDLSIGSLALKDIGISGNKPIVFWRSEVGSVASNISGFLDVENMANTVAKEMSYAESDENNNINDAMPKQTRT